MSEMIDLFFCLSHFSITNPANMNCIIPCDLRSNSTNIIMGNQIAHFCIELPMDIEGNIPLLWSLNEKTKKVKQNGDYATMYLFTHIIYLLFPFCLGRINNKYKNLIIFRFS